MSTTFTDNRGNTWNIQIKFRDVERVKKHVVGADGRPVDLLEIAEKGDFRGISGNVQTVVNICFWLLLDDILTRFDEASYDRYMNTLPSENQTKLQKAADWFGSLLGGAEILALVKAWENAIINFIPNPRVQQAVRNVMEKQEAYQTAIIEKAEEMSVGSVSAGLEKLSGVTRENWASIRESSASANLSGWQKDGESLAGDKSQLLP